MIRRLIFVKNYFHFGEKFEFRSQLSYYNCALCTALLQEKKKTKTCFQQLLLKTSIQLVNLHSLEIEADGFLLMGFQCISKQILMVKFYSILPISIKPSFFKYVLSKFFHDQIFFTDQLLSRQQDEIKTVFFQLQQPQSHFIHFSTVNKSRN